MRTKRFVFVIWAEPGLDKTCAQTANLRTLTTSKINKVDFINALPERFGNRLSTVGPRSKEPLQLNSPVEVGKIALG